ncbi:TonB-dependent receptor [bacterium]|nr:TonB-dependent receptor [bacterium]
MKKNGLLAWMVIALFLAGYSGVKAENQEQAAQKPATEEALSTTADVVSKDMVEEATFVEKKEEIAEFEMEQFVVTGTRSERVLSDVSVRTEVITNEEILDKGAVTLYEALDGIVGVRVEQQCSYCNFSMIRLQGLEGDHVQILLDGQPLYSGLAGVYGLHQFPTSNIERIEIVKGAGSALYGSNAIAGVINIITKKPLKKGVVEMSSSFGTYNTNTYSLSASTRLNDQADLLIFTQKDSGDEIDENNDKLTDRVRTDNMTTGFNLNYAGLLGKDGLNLRGKILNENRVGGDLTDNMIENAYAEGSEHITTARQELSIGYKKELFTDSELGLNLAYSRHGRNATNDTFVGDYLATHGDQYPASDMLNPYIANETQYVADLNYAQIFSGAGKHCAQLGLVFIKNRLTESGMYVRVDETEPATLGEFYRASSEKTAQDWGVYLQDEWKIMDGLELVIGARYDAHKSEDTFAGSGDAGLEDVELTYEETVVSPRGAIMYKPTSNLTLRASVGQGFRVPYTFSEDLHLCSGSPRVFKGPGLKPEKALSYNLDINFTQGAFRLDATAFRTDVEDKIDLADAEEFANNKGYDYEWQNMGRAYTQGVELTADVVLLKDFSVAADLGYTDARYSDIREDWAEHPVHGDLYADDSKHISRIPEMTGGLKLTWAPGYFRAVLDADYTGPMYIDYNAEDDVENPNSEIVHADAFIVFNARVSHTFSEIGLTLFAGVKNLLDEIQTDKRPDDAAFMYKPYTGRIIYGGAKFAF